MTTEISKGYQPGDVETQWFDRWVESGCFRGDENSSNEAYSIVIPPPNVTGILHLGHVLNTTIQDILARRARMEGKDVLWLPGTDHAGIATQSKVEQKLRKDEGKTRRDLGRDAFLEKVWEWKEEHGGIIIQQLKRLGCSCDWERERFTMDENYSQWISKIFVDLFEEGLIYRGKRMVNWCPKSLTALSDEEVIMKPQKSKLYYMRYKVVGEKDRWVEIATTRPETLMGDSGVAVNPKDERYGDLVGKKVLRPFPEAEIPVVADEHIDPEFGTGVLKVTPAHDKADFEIGIKNNLEIIDVFNSDATLNELAGPEFKGMDRFEAREKTAEKLEELGLLVKVEDYENNVGFSERADVPIEPRISMQWFLKYPCVQEAADAVASDEIRFRPERWKKTYAHWMEGIQDWCISRQLWWGHRVPAWYDEAGNVYVGESESGVREAHSIPDATPLRQDDDVLDTWFSSALWTFSTLGWPDKKHDLSAFHPASVLVTGFDIIFFWVARMIMMSLHFMEEVPFHTVYVHGLVRDGEGQKMSKSKGNVLDPIDLIDGIDLEALIQKRTSNLMQPKIAAKIEKATCEQFPKGITGYGTDALRYTFYSLASTGRDIKFDIGRMQGYRNFCNKIWNASRYVLSHTKSHNVSEGDATLSLADRWIQSRLETTLIAVEEAYDNYRFDLASQALYDFVWNEFCDWYLELSKPVLWDEATAASEQLGARRTLITVLEKSLRLLHPFMPFLTEEIWQTVSPLAGQTGESIMLAPWPARQPDRTDAESEAEIEWLKQIIVGIRTIRSESNIPPATELPVFAVNTTELDRERFRRNEAYLGRLAKVSGITVLSEEEAPPASLMALCGDLEIRVPMAGVIDIEAELKRLDKEIERQQKEVAKLEGKLSNKAFTERAPSDIVEAEKQKKTQADTALVTLGRQRTQIEELRSA